MSLSMGNLTGKDMTDMRYIDKDVALEYLAAYQIVSDHVRPFRKVESCSKVQLKFDEIHFSNNSSNLWK